jgi:hypothetical protein
MLVPQLVSATCYPTVARQVNLAKHSLPILTPLPICTSYYSPSSASLNDAHHIQAQFSSPTSSPKKLAFTFHLVQSLNMQR